jgi:hypothetical protein
MNCAPWRDLAAIFVVERRAGRRYQISAALELGQLPIDRLAANRERCQPIEVSDLYTRDNVGFGETEVDRDAAALLLVASASSQ